MKLNVYSDYSNRVYMLDCLSKRKDVGGGGGVAKTESPYLCYSRQRLL